MNLLALFTVICTVALVAAVVFAVRRGVAYRRAVDERDRARDELDRERRSLEDEIDRNTVMLLRHQLALDAGQLGVWDWDLVEDTVAWSQNVEELHGLEPGAFGDHYRRFLECVHPDDCDRYESAITGALHGEQDFDLEYRVVWPDGTVRWMRSVGEVYRDPDGEPVRLIGVLMDISGRRAAEDAASESEIRYRALVEQVPTVTYTVACEPETPALFISPQIEDLVGYPPEEFYADSHRWERCVHPDDRDALLGLARACQEDGGAFAAEYRVIARSGRVVWVRDEATLIRDERGEPRYLQGIVIDVTERKQAEKALRAQAARAEALAELGQRALAGTDLAMLFDNAVKLVANALEPDGCGVVEILADGHTMVLRAGHGVPPDAQNRPLALDPDVAAALRSSAPIVMTDTSGAGGLRLPSPLAHDGSRSGIAVVVEGRTRPFGVLYAQAGLPDSFSSQDANFLQAVAHVLANAIGRREAEDQLLQAQKMDAVGRLAGGIAHDFNNLMTAILGYGELLEKRVAEDQQARQHLREILHAGRRATSLVEQLLSFSRVGMSRPALVDVNDAVRSMHGMLSRLIDERIELRCELEPGLGQVLCDPNRLEQVILNLVVNARDAMPDGGQLTVSTADVADSPRQARPYVRLSVADTGVGMDAVTAARAFEPFFTTKREGKGTGIGLSTVYGIATAAGGRVQVDSEPGLGTTVMIDLPYADSTAVAQSQDDTPSVPAGGGGETVLLVEDQEAVRSLLSEVLAEHGYRVHAAADGADALSMLAGGDVHPDLLVTDVVMPQLGGRELAERVRQDRPNLRILYISGYSDRQTPPTDPSAGFLAKPFTVAALLGAIRELLDA